MKTVTLFLVVGANETTWMKKLASTLRIFVSTAAEKLFPMAAVESLMKAEEVYRCPNCPHAIFSHSLIYGGCGDCACESLTGTGEQLVEERPIHFVANLDYEVWRKEGRPELFCTLCGEGCSRSRASTMTPKRNLVTCDIKTSVVHQ